MSTRLLVLVSVIFAAVSAYLYFNQERIEHTKGSMIERYDYWANDISAVQTNELGQAHILVNASRLVHDPKTDTLSLNSLDARMKQVGDDNATFRFVSKTATWHQPTFKLALTNGVTVTRHISTVNTDKNRFPDIKFTTEALQANTKAKTLVGKFPVKMTMNNSLIQADAMRADLNRGEYQFDKLQAQYVQ